jgi:hypothetical protein
MAVALHEHPATAIERVRSLTSRDEDFDELLRQVHRLATLARYSIGSICDVGTTVYRAISHHVSVPSRLEQIWYPTAECIPNFGRANRDADGAFREIRVLERARSGRSLPEKHLTFEGELKSAHIRDVGQRREVDSRITFGDTHRQHC